MGKKFIFLVLAILLITMSNAALAQDVVKFGIAEPMTGAMAVGGKLAMRGYELAHEQNPMVLGKQVELVFVDNKSDKVEAANAVSWLIEREGVVALFVGYGSDMAIAGGEAANKAGIPLLSATATNPLVTQDKKYVFRACFTDPFQGQVMARYTIENLGITKAALLVDIAQDYSVGLANSYKRTFEKMGGEIVSDFKYNTGDQDFSAQLSQIITSGAEALFFPGYVGDIALIAIQGRELGFTGRYLGGDTLHNPVLIELAGEAAEGLIASTLFAEDQPATPQSVKFAKLFREKYNLAPNPVSILCYDSYNLMVNAIERAGSLDPAAIRDALAATRNYPGADGFITIDENGDAVKSAVLVTIVNGKYKYLTTVSPSSIPYRYKRSNQ
jgi:branched-chain amino acid transport system substrate-binding protein